MPAVPVPSDKLSASLEANRRLARLAITRFAVDPVRVERVLRAAQLRQAAGDDVDLLVALTGARVLTMDQAERLRLEAPAEPAFDVENDTDEPRATKLDMPGVNGKPRQMGHYRILRLLGQGGMGAVYLAFDSNENRQVAVKVLAADQAPRSSILRRFQLEGKHGAMLVHDNIVRSYDSGKDELTGLHYIVLEYIDGPTAHDLLERAGKMHVGDAVHIVLDIARAVEHAHKNQIIHRDIKPANILLTRSGLAKLSDLGLAKRRDDTANLTSADQGIGTPYYVPYEQAMNAKKADERSDIFALGATLYHLVTGEVPFNGESSLEITEKKGLGSYAPASTLNPVSPAKLDEVLARMLARDPANRYQTVSEVIVDLERSQLAAVIPSFVNVDAAMQDPVVAQRLMSPIEATQPDMQVQKARAEKQAKEQQPWFLKYHDSRGTLCKAKGTTAEIIERLKKGTLPLHTEAARSPHGKFKALETWPEFQSAIAAARIAKLIEPAAEPAAVGIRWEPLLWGAAAALGVGIVTLLIVTVYVMIGT